MIKKILIANRGEIAIRIMRAVNELGRRTVAIYAEEDKLSFHRFKADESYRVGKGLGPVKAYLHIEDIVRTAIDTGCDAVHPGYGFLSESPEFVDACEGSGLTFIGPSSDVMRLFGNKVSARRVAEEAGVPVMPATGPLSDDWDEVHRMAKEVGFPVMLKASWGGGGRGMRVIEDASSLEEKVTLGRREAGAAFGKDEVYIEKLVEEARHVEVQLLGDRHGNIVHLWERDCTVQHRNQKVIERAPALYLDEEQREFLCASAVKLARKGGYYNAGTAEFLMDVRTGNFYFIEINPRIQVEHTVTEEVTGIDLVKAQIFIAEGARIGEGGGSGVPSQENIKLRGHALQCRITTENPETGFTPDYGRITDYRDAAGFGIRIDGGTAYSGAIITHYYDSLLEKVTAWSSTPNEAIDRMSRALREYRIRGLTTNIPFLRNVLNHEKFRTHSYTTKFIDETPDLLNIVKHADSGTRLLNFISEVTVNGNPEVAGLALPSRHADAVVPEGGGDGIYPRGTKDLLLELGPEGFRDWMLEQRGALVTDTTMRDAHQSLLATRMRTYDMLQVAESYAQKMSGLFSLECWGGATFDVAMRFLKECPWQRLEKLRERVPNILFQMLLRASNGVGYTNYPDNVVRHFVKVAAEKGIDVFRVFDSLNWIENMRVAMDAVNESGKLCEAAICYTGDIFDERRSRYDLKYYVGMAKDLERAGAHILCIKDMAGLLKPSQAKVLIRALKEEVGLPIHFHTHDTSGISAATVMAALEVGVDAVDGAMDSFSGLTSQPNLGSIVEALRFTDRDTGLDPVEIRRFSDYWESVRRKYAAFESDLRCGASEVYLHEMPGGQFTNLKEQARSMGLESKWHEIAKAYADVNMMFGDIVKVTPSSKVVGDMALAMVSGGLSRDDVEDESKEISFPESVVSFFRGEIGKPPGGFPEALQRKVLKGGEPLGDRPGALMPPIDFVSERELAEGKAGRVLTESEFLSYLMYPKVFLDYVKHSKENGPVIMLPTSIFFYGMKVGDSVEVEVERGRVIIVRCLAIGEGDEEGWTKMFFEVNGQARTVNVLNRLARDSAPQREKAEEGNLGHVASPIPGVISTVNVSEGMRVNERDLLLTIEAMKMETAVYAERGGVVERVLAPTGTNVHAKDLLLVIKPD